MSQYPYAPPSRLAHLAPYMAGLTMQGPAAGSPKRATGIVIHMDVQSREEIEAALDSLKGREEAARGMMEEFNAELGLKKKFDPYNHPLFNRGGGVKESILYEEVKEDVFILVKA